MGEHGGFPKFRGTLFGCPNNEDYSILGSIFGSPYSLILGNYHVSRTFSILLVAFSESLDTNPCALPRGDSVSILYSIFVTL